jgi:hypothetical protein
MQLNDFEDQLSIQVDVAPVAVGGIRLSLDPNLFLLGNMLGIHRTCEVEEPRIDLQIIS